MCKLNLSSSISNIILVGDLAVSEETIALLPEGYLPVSVKSGQNVPELRQHIERMLLDLTAILQQRQEQEQEREETKW